MQRNGGIVEFRTGVRKRKGCQIGHKFRGPICHVLDISVDDIFPRFNHFKWYYIRIFENQEICFTLFI